MLDGFAEADIVRIGCGSDGASLLVASVGSERTTLATDAEVKPQAPLLMLSMRELTIALFLFTTDTRLLSIVIFDDYDNGILQRAATTSLLYCIIIFALAILARRFGAKQES